MALEFWTEGELLSLAVDADDDSVIANFNTFDVKALSHHFHLGFFAGFESTVIDNRQAVVFGPGDSVELEGGERRWRYLSRGVHDAKESRGLWKERVFSKTGRARRVCESRFDELVLLIRRRCRMGRAGHRNNSED